MSYNNRLEPPSPSPNPFNKEQRQLRRMTSPANFRGPPQRPLGLPGEEHHQGWGQDQLESEDGDESQLTSRDDAWSQRNGEQREGVARRLSNTFARVSSLVANSINSQSSATSPSIGAYYSPNMLPSDAELEAEAEREREISRREAERILTMEAEERRKLEERVLAMLSPPQPNGPSFSSSPSTKEGGGSSPKPSESSSKREEGGGWWSMAKQRLTPTKDKEERRESMTPAQQVVYDTKIREKAEKERAKLFKKSEKEKEKDWPGPGRGTALQAPQTPTHRQETSVLTPSPVPHPMHSSSMPLPSHPPSSAPRSTHSANGSMSAITSIAPSQATTPGAAPLYIQYLPDGNLDVVGTLVGVAKRFEKLEKWAVSHVRALEDRMQDVERYLVEREGPEEKVRKEVDSLRSSLGDLKQDFTSFKSNLPLTPPMSTSTTSASIAPPAPAQPTQPPALVQQVPRTQSTPPLSTPQSGSRALPSIPGSADPGEVPDMATIRLTATGSRSRLPYPTGDYAPPAPFASTSQSGSPVLPLPRSVSPLSLTPRERENERPRSLPVSTTQPLTGSIAARLASTTPSPTPRKRYTVALSGRDDNNDPNQERQIQTAMITTSPPHVIHTRPTPTPTARRSSPSPTPSPSPSPSPPPTHERETTIGRTPIVLSRLSTSPPPSQQHSPANVNTLSQSMSNNYNDVYSSHTPSPQGNTNSRIRAQSTYFLPAPTPSAPLNPRKRAQSSERINTVSSIFPDKEKTFVDPLVVRKKERVGGEREIPIGAKYPATGKIPFGQLKAFFDGAQ